METNLSSCCSRGEVGRRLNSAGFDMLHEERLLVRLAASKSPYLLNAVLMKHQIRENFLIPPVFRLVFKCFLAIGEVTAMPGHSEIQEARLDSLLREGEGFCLAVNGCCEGSSFLTFCSLLWLCQVRSKQSTRCTFLGTI